MNDYRIVISNSTLGLEKEISAPTQYDLEIKVENQRRIWKDKEQRELTRQNKETIKSLSQELTARDTKSIEEYENILKEITIQSYDDYYESLLDKSLFGKFKSRLVKPTQKHFEENIETPPKSWLELFSKTRKGFRLEKEREAEELKIKKENELKEQYNRELDNYSQEYNKEMLKYNEEKKNFKEEQEKFNKGIEHAKEKFIDSDTKQIEKYFEYVLYKSKFPTNFIKDFELQYKEEEKLLIVSYRLPNVDSIPNILQHKYISTRNQIEEIKLSDKKLEKFYNDIIYMCSLKTIKEIFESDKLNHISNIVYNGWIKYIDKSIGKETGSCIISIQTSKEKFLNINLQNVDYKECIKGLKGICAPSILSLTPVTPYMKINKEDSRFIESKQAENILLDGFNLATMPWEDFEYFVRELFEKMFNENGGEVKVTQASHDGGVDAIAFDEDPIRGGKFVIQAKRYNNVVPVSAVRDLYGTMINEGAIKGILITTSSYGKESYDFAREKPIKLIDGQEMLGLLNKYGYNNLKIKITK